MDRFPFIHYIQYNNNDNELLVVVTNQYIEGYYEMMRAAHLSRSLLNDSREI